MIFTLGSGYRQSLQSFMTSLAEPDQVAMLYTLMLIVDALASFIASPLLATMLAVGLSTSNVPVGLPFLVCAALYMLSGICIWCIR